MAQWVNTLQDKPDKLSVVMTRTLSGNKELRLELFSDLHWYIMAHIYI